MGMETRQLAASVLLALVVLYIAPSVAESGAKGRNGNERGQGTYLWIHKPDSCKRRVHLQPNGPFAVILFCEDAQGSHIGVIYYDQLSKPAGAKYEPKWGLSDRMWQVALWASDVTSFAWTPDRARLFVGTGNIYGSGGLFELDLKERSAKQIAPAGDLVSVGAPGPGFVITGLDLRKRLLQYEIVPWNIDNAAGRMKFTLSLKEE